MQPSGSLPCQPHEFRKNQNRMRKDASPGVSVLPPSKVGCTLEDTPIRTTEANLAEFHPAVNEHTPYQSLQFAGDLTVLALFQPGYGCSVASSVTLEVTLAVRASQVITAGVRWRPPEMRKSDGAAGGDRKAGGQQGVIVALTSPADQMPRTCYLIAPLTPGRKFSA